MAMTVQNVIDGLRADIELGRFKADDLLVIDWFSYHDIQRTAETFENDDEARKLWEKTVERIDVQLDWFDKDQIDDLIQEMVDANG